MANNDKIPTRLTAGLDERFDVLIEWLQENPKHNVAVILWKLSRIDKAAFYHACAGVMAALEIREEHLLMHGIDHECEICMPLSAPKKGDDNGKGT